MIELAHDAKHIQPEEPSQTRRDPIDELASPKSEKLDIQCCTSPARKVSQRRRSSLRCGLGGRHVFDTYSDLTQMQLLLLHGSLAKPGSNVIRVYDTYKTSDLPIVKNAWHAIIHSEPVFRSKLVLDNTGKGRLSHSLLRCPCWTERTMSSREDYVSLLNKDEQHTLLGTSLEAVTFNDGKFESLCTIIWRCHHGLIYGFSASLIYSKLRMSINGAEPLPSTPIAEIMSHVIEDELSSRVTNREFWAMQKAKFPGVTSKLLLPVPPTTGIHRPSTLASTSFSFSASRALNVARRARVSVASIYHAAWATTLSSFMNSDSVCFGAVLSCRSIDANGIESTVGALINTLPLNTSVDRHWHVEEYLRRVYQALVDLSSVHASVIADGFDREFDSLIAMQFAMEPAPSDAVARPVVPPRMSMVGDIPLSVFVWPNGPVKLEYHSTRFAVRDIENITIYFENALCLLTSHHGLMDELLRDLMPVPIAQDILKISHVDHEATMPGSVHEDLVVRFEHTVRNYGWATAVENEATSLTYRELDGQAIRVATYLSGTVGVGDVVCVNAGHSINWIVAIFGILKAGAAYSPLDPKLPPLIIKANFAAANAKLLLVDSEETKRLPHDLRCPVFSVEEILKTPWEGAKLLRHRDVPRPQDSAYICFTSGSSGKPKGVVCTHEGLLAFHSSDETRMYSAPGNRVAQTMSPAFDGSIHEIFSALGWGSTLVLPSARDPFAHLQTVDAAVMTPSIAIVLDPDECPHLRTVSVVGESLPQSVSDAWSSRIRLLNMYGPTEGTCGATTRLMKPGWRVTIGTPNPTTRLHILDRHENFCPPNVSGEIHLAGIQVAKGYVGRPEETWNKFVVDPFVGYGKQTMYRTGDRGFWNARGEVECLGRNNRTIKLRGFRLDLDDLETRVEQALPDVKGIALVAGDDDIVAAVQPSSLGAADLCERLKESIPEYAIPKSVKAMDVFPRTPIGKIDYAKISQIALGAPTPAPGSKGRLSTTEQAIAAIWKQTLGVDKNLVISPESDFRLIGGHSLLQIVLIERLRETFDVDIPLRMIIDNQTLRAISSLTDILVSEKAPCRAMTTIVHPVQALGRNNLSPLDRDLWCK